LKSNGVGRHGLLRQDILSHCYRPLNVPQIRGSGSFVAASPVFQGSRDPTVTQNLRDGLDGRHPDQLSDIGDQWNPRGSYDEESAILRFWRYGTFR
jgi:hypothetical protein